jgi:DNA-binding LytR/AlgR family response regulator
MKTRCLIVDDEPLAIEAIQMHIEKLDSLKLVATCTDAIKAFDILRNHQIDLIFLDIQMPEMTGLDFVKSIKNPPRVIFTTAYRDYAIDAFDLDVVDYLLKPISFDRFMQAVNKYFDGIPNDLLVSNTTESTIDDFFYIKSERKNIKIHFREILYIESIKDYVKIVCRKRTVISKIMISELIDQLHEQSFLRIHRSYIVYIPNVEAFSAISVEVPGKELPIGRNYKNETLKTLKQGLN